MRIISLLDLKFFEGRKLVFNFLFLCLKPCTTMRLNVGSLVMIIIFTLFTPCTILLIWLLSSPLLLPNCFLDQGGVGWKNITNQLSLVKHANCLWSCYFMDQENGMVKKSSGTSLPGFECQPNHILAVCLSSDLTCLYLTVIICEMRIMIMPILLVVKSIKGNKTT